MYHSNMNASAIYLSCFSEETPIVGMEEADARITGEYWSLLQNSSLLGNKDPLIRSKPRDISVRA